MTFLQLTGVELDRELGSSSTSLFTTVARKAAVNAAQLEWVKRTECLQKETAITLVDGTQEYDIESTITDFAWIAKRGPRIKIVSGTTTRYIQGKDLEFTSTERLDDEEPGWQSASASTPTKYYIRRDGGTVNIGFHPAPDISGSDVWTVIIPYVIIPADMTADVDEPFTVSANILKSMRPWHRALVHFAAFDLEKLRKDQARGAAQLQLFELEIAKFTGVEKPKGGVRMRFATDYRGRAAGRSRSLDPRT